MVFESVVADLLNRFLGDFVDNLDASQLNIGIWGGDIKLDNIEIKETALDEMELPVKLKYGYLKNLKLKIPWKSLYTEPVIADVEGLYMIVVPNKGVVYNEEKAQKNIQEDKRKKLQRLEENRRRKRTKVEGTGDGFTEKLVAQIIKNLQIRIRNIHIRYEDKYTNRHRPFAVGVSLEDLQFQTTDANWKETIHKEAVKIVYKLVSLNSLAIYWNSDIQLISDINDRQDVERLMIEGIASSGKKPKNYTYILEPITMQAKLSMNQKPETDGTDWKTPKINLIFDMETLALFIGKLQYQDVLLVLDAQERASNATRYLKYRPDLNEYAGHYKIWWHFAYQSVIEEQIKRKKRNWSWEHMKTHRCLVRDYKEAWIKKQIEKNVEQEYLKIIEKAEELLDIFNINVARQQAEFEIDRLGLTRLEDQPQGWLNWAKSWWGGGSGSKSKDQSKDVSGNIVSQFEEAMTPDEKSKLYEAIDYQENTPPTDYPKHFVENVISMNLRSVEVVVENSLHLKFMWLKGHMEQRPSANAINLTMAIKCVEMSAQEQPILTMLDPDSEWLNIFVDTNPLNREENNYDQHLKLSIAPTLLKYHALGINSLLDVLKPPESVRLHKLAAAAMARYEDVKKRSLTGLSHAVEMKTKLVLDISIAPATIVVSESGVFDEAKTALVVDLGVFEVKSVEEEFYRPETVFEREKTMEERREELLKRAYDKFDIKLSNVRITLGDDYQAAKKSLELPSSHCHILRPTGMNIQVHKSSIDDVQLPNIRILGDLPDIVVSLADEQLIKLVKLLASIPLPPPSETVNDDSEIEKTRLRDKAKMHAIMEADELEDKTEITKTDASGDSEMSRNEQIALEMHLLLNQVLFIIGRKHEILLSVQVRRLGCALVLRNFDMVVNAHLGDLLVEQPQYRSLIPGRDTLFLLDNSHESDEHLVDIKFISANPESPFFDTVYRSTEQSVTISFKSLKITLCQEALLSLKEFIEALQKNLEQIRKEHPELAQREEIRKRKLSRVLSQSSIISNSKEKLSRKISELRHERKLQATLNDDQTMKLCAKASFDTLAVYLGMKDALSTAFMVSNVGASIVTKTKATQIVAGLRELQIEDCTGNTRYKKLLSVCGQEEVFTLDVLMFTRTDDEKKKMSVSDVDMMVKAHFARLQFIFMNIWIVRLMAWLGPFQQEAALAASQAQALAAEKATETVASVRKQLMEEVPPRAHLDIELAAPTIIVPQSSNSSSALIFDFGKLFVTNTIYSEAKQPKAFMDQMEISLTEVNFAIGVLSRSGEITSKCQILEPLSFSLTILRSLSFAWYKDKPEVSIDAHISALHLCMSQEDYATIMMTLNGNLAEGNHAPVENISVSQDERNNYEPKRYNEDKVNVGEGAVERTEQTSSNTETAVRFAVKFTVDEVAAILYSGSSNLNETTGIVVREDSMKFGAVRLVVLQFNVFIREDGALTAGCVLKGFTMKDERITGTGIRRLLDKRADETGEVQEDFIDAYYEQNSAKDKIVRFSSSSFFLCLNPEFLGALASFFTIPNKDDEDSDTTQSSRIKTIETGKGTNASRSSAGFEGTLLMDCKMRRVEIILVEDSSKPDSTQALFLTFSCAIKGRHDGTNQVFDGGVHKLEMFSSYYEEKKRSFAPYQVMNPTSLSVKGIISSSKSQDVEIELTPIHLKVSPSIIRLLSAVSSSFSAANQVQNIVKKKHVPVLKKYPNYWDKKKIDRSKFWWFCNTASSGNEELLDYGIDVAETFDHEEKALIRMESLVITLEAGTGKLTTPMILLEMSLTGVVSDWSSLLAVKTTLTLQVSYYNEKFCVWEPVIEPIEVGNGLLEKWKLDCEIVTNSDAAMLQVQQVQSGPSQSQVTLPKQTIKINALNMMNITITKSFLQLLNELSESFQAAAKQVSPQRGRELPGSTPYLILNNTGMVVKVANSDSLKVNQKNEYVLAKGNEYVDLQVPSDDKIMGLSESQDTKKAMLSLLFDEMNTEREINVMRAEIRALNLPRKDERGVNWKVVSETEIVDLRRLITLRSLLQFVNHTNLPFEVHSMLSEARLELCGVATVDSEPLNIALEALYSPTGSFYLKPLGDSFEMSNEPISWYTFEDKQREIIRCDSSADPTTGFYVALVVEQVPVKAEKSNNYIDVAFVVHLFHPLTLHNFLPFPLQIIHPTQQVLEGGEDMDFNTYPHQRITFELLYRDEVYTGELEYSLDHEDLEVVTLETKNDAVILNLGIHWSTQHRRMDVEIYSPYWFINNTGKTLKYVESGSRARATSFHCLSSKSGNHLQADRTVTHESFSGPAFLHFEATEFLNKKKSKIQLAGTCWSDEFPLDAVGNAGRITCKSEERDYEVSLDVQLCHSGLTKVITFSPFYMVSNVSEFDMEVKEFGQEEWILVKAKNCVGLWPRQQQKRKYLIVRYVGTDEESIMFPFTENFEQFCHINNAYLGVYVTCTLGDSSSVIRLEPFSPGMAPALLMNATDREIKFSQKDCATEILGPGEYCFFTWSNVTADRVLKWSSGDETHTDGLFKNTYETYKVPGSSKSHFWVSFLNGRQRVLLFTQEFKVLSLASDTEIGSMNQQIEMNLQGIGLSIVDNLNAEEILYIGIASSAITWEQFTRSRFKLFATAEIDAIERAYQSWLEKGSQGVVTINGSEIDFANMKLKKKKSEVTIRRQFQTGLWLQYSVGTHRTALHLKVNHLQIDNQMYACVFPCVLSMVEPPKSVVAVDAPKPFVELSFIMTLSEHSKVVNIKYLHLLVQEFAVQIDQGLINALLGFIASSNEQKPYTKEMYEKDLELTNYDLSQLAMTSFSSSQQAFYEDLHISPLMIHFSFSQGGSVVSKDKGIAVPIQSEFINVLLKSVGVTLTELQDVVFKLAFFDRHYSFYNKQQIQAEVISHYTKQGIKQLYVLVLGLDIIGNPFGLVRDLTAGVEDFFYQPFQGAIQGPEEFAEGVALGVKSLFGATVGGATGAASRITGTLGKGVAALTLDEDYQRKRQQALNRRPQNFGEGMARGFKDVGVGVVEGITGVVTKPIEGARTGGVGGFAKGLGKGLVGAVTRPVSGVVDCASSSLNAVKTIASGEHGVKPLRPPRVILSDNVVRPYSQKTAIGAKVFRDTNHGAIAETDHFIAHSAISEKCVFIVTDKRAFLSKKSDIVGSWGIDWEILYKDMKPPIAVEKGVKLELKKKQSGFLGIGGSNGKVVQFTDSIIAEEIIGRLVAAYEDNTQG